MSRRICIAFAGDLSTPSGGTDRITALAAGLHERSFDVSLVVPTPEGAIPSKLGDVDVRPVDPDLGPVSNSLARAWRVTRAAGRVARRRDAALQIEHSTLAGVGTFHLNEPFVLDMHDLAHARFDHVDNVATPILERGVSWIERRAVDRARHVVVVSEYMRDFLVDEWGYDERSISVVPNGYFEGRIQKYRDVEGDSNRVCFLGTLHPKVHFETFAMIADLSAVSEMVVIGDGAQRDRVKELAETHDSLRVTGRLPDQEAFELLAGSTVAINPQEPSDLQRSSSPVKLYYYAALGLPMVATEGPPVVDQLAGEEAVLTAQPGEPFAESVEKILGDETLAKRLEENARSAAEAFRWSQRVDFHERVHSDVSRSKMTSRSTEDG
jgi:glycosyltransferase involved in cell wall biosynthesis